MGCMKEGKVLSKADRILSIVKDCRVLGQRVVLAPGCFDLLHLGHIRHLEQAKTFGEVLIAVVTADAHVSKGPGRPAFSIAQRMEAVEALSCVDYVIPSDLFGDGDSGIKYLEAIRPQFWVRGGEYSPNNPKGVTEVETCHRIGCRDVYTDLPETFSSTKLLSQSSFSPVPERARQWLDAYKTKYRKDLTTGVQSYFRDSGKLKTLVVGEAILDEYAYVEVLGKSGKEPVLVVREKKREEFLGGSAIVRKHVMEFCDYVGLVTQGLPIRKTRFVNEYPFQKMFQVQCGDDSVKPLTVHELHKGLEYDILGGEKAYDLVVALDYGHGMFGDGVIDYLNESKDLFLALNVQANASNFGYNTINRWLRADYLCLSENELRLAYNAKNGDVKDLVTKTAERMGCKYITVTKGRDGVLVWGKNQGFVEVPAFTDHFVDRVGAGDAVLAITSLLAVQSAPIDVIGLVANAVGALAVSIVCNREPVKKEQLLRYMKGLLA